MRIEDITIEQLNEQEAKYLTAGTDREIANRDWGLVKKILHSNMSRPIKSYVCDMLVNPDSTATLLVGLVVMGIQVGLELAKAELSSSSNSAKEG